MSEQQPPPSRNNPKPDSNTDRPMNSPIRPTDPTLETPKVEPPKPAFLQETQLTRAVLPDAPESPAKALEILRHKMENIANEYASGKINQAQFNAIYGRYSEQRTIIERLIARDPDNPAWKQAATPGHTSFLRSHFEARTNYYLVFRHRVPRPLMMGGDSQPDIKEIGRVLSSLWNMKNRPKKGLARKAMGKDRWLVLALGEFAVTLVMFTLEPSVAQMQLIGDLHADFERANRNAMERGTQTLERLVFPQRALVE